jgi:hypothetical protein
MKSKKGPEWALTEAVKMVSERGKVYGDIEANFERIAKIATILTNKDISPFDIAIIMSAVKLSRIANSPSYSDSYVDLINYISFANSLKEGDN